MLSQKDHAIRDKVGRSQSNGRPTINVKENTPSPEKLDQSEIIKLKQKDNWNKIVEFNKKVYEIQQKEEEDKKKINQIKMREVLHQQQQQKQIDKCIARENELGWMKQNMERINREITEVERKKQQKRDFLKNLTHEYATQ